MSAVVVVTKQTQYLFKIVKTDQRDTNGEQRKKFEFQTVIDPMTSWSPGGGSIHWAMRIYGEQGHVDQFTFHNQFVYEFLKWLVGKKNQIITFH